MLWFINVPPPDTRTRGCTASGSRVGPGRASTAPSEWGRAGRRPERPEPPISAATSFLDKHKGRDIMSLSSFTVHMQLLLYWPIYKTALRLHLISSLWPASLCKLIKKTPGYSEGTKLIPTLYSTLLYLNISSQISTLRNFKNNGSVSQKREDWSAITNSTHITVSAAQDAKIQNSESKLKPKTK